MNDLDALLAGIVAHPHESLRWLILADWLDDHGFAERAELLRRHRMLIDTYDLPLTNFVASDFAMLNGRLAEHYGIPGVDG